MKDKEKTELPSNKNLIKPDKLMGQNFLISEKFRQKIIETADLSPEDTVIEVGAGNGSLTLEIAKKAKRVFAVEKDKRFASALQKLVLEENLKNIIVINEDILKLDLTTGHCEESRSKRDNEAISKKDRKIEIASLPSVARNDDKIICGDELKNYKLIGNIPYYLTSRLLRKFLAEEELKPKEIILTVQKEVAERITASPPHMNLLALSVQAYGKPKIIEKIPASAFWPQPKVDSAIIKISEISNKFFEGIITQKIATEKQKGGIAQNSRYRVNFTQTQNYIQIMPGREMQKMFFKLIKTAFSQKRKTLANSLTNFFGDKKTAETAIQGAGLNKNVRPEELSLENWVKLIK